MKRKLFIKSGNFYYDNERQSQYDSFIIQKNLKSSLDLEEWLIKQLEYLKVPYFDPCCPNVPICDLCGSEVPNLTVNLINGYPTNPTNNQFYLNQDSGNLYFVDYLGNISLVSQPDYDLKLTGYPSNGVNYLSINSLPNYPSFGFEFNNSINNSLTVLRNGLELTLNDDYIITGIFPVMNLQLINGVFGPSSGGNSTNKEIITINMNIKYLV